MDRKEIFLYRGETSAGVKKNVFLLCSSFMLTSTRVAINPRRSHSFSKSFYLAEATRHHCYYIALNNIFARAEYESYIWVT